MMHDSAEPVLTLTDVSKTYPRRLGQKEARVAVQGVSFAVRRGEILGLLGPNGAGKTTTIKMSAGLVRPTSGQIRIGDRDVATERSIAVRGLGAVLEGNRNLHWKLTVRENLAYFGALKGVRRPADRIVDICHQLDLDLQLDRRVGELSRGNQQRVAIAVALLGQPEILLLDEPTLGLDVVAASHFKDIVRQIAAGGCGIVLTTHQMEVAQALSDRIAVISQGRLAALDSLDLLLRAHTTPGYEVVVRGAIEGGVALALAAHGARSIASDGALSRFSLEDGSDVYALIAGPLRDAGLELVRIQQREVNLEAIYLRILGQDKPLGSPGSHGSPESLPTAGQQQPVIR